MSTKRPGGADWNRLSALAAGQAGYFSTRQAGETGYSYKLLTRYTATGTFTRLRRGIYRLAHFPPSAQEDLVVQWIWSEQAGIFSHETALAQHGLSDVLPARTHLTVPPAWQEQRRRLPEGLVLHYAALRDDERTWMGSVPVTSVLRTLADCAHAHVAAELVESAVTQALDRGLVTAADVARVAQNIADKPKVER